MTGVNNAASRGSKKAGNRRNPQQTKRAILKAAIKEFSTKGLEGARVDEIADRARVNKRMLYHYFGNKEELFKAVLEAVYSEIRSDEAKLNLEQLKPERAVRVLIDYTFDIFLTKPYWIRLLNSENLHNASHIKRSSSIQAVTSPLIKTITDILDRGVKDGVFRDQVDPLQLYISIASLSYFYFSNNATLSTIFNRNLKKVEALQERRQHITEFVLGYLRPE